MLCHGRGDSEDGFNGGCCFLAGAICDNRWYFEYADGDPNVQNATIYDATGASLGTVYDYVDNLMPGGGPNKADRMQRVFDQIQGTIYACSIPAYLLGMDPSLINDRPTLDAQWMADPAYQPVADYWESIGQPREWCSTFGPSEGHCCFRDPAENEAQQAFLTVDSITVRGSAQGASPGRRRGQEG